MIEKRTVFILGAGASCPYGFPTARGLRTRIIEDFVGQYRQHAIESQPRLHDKRGNFAVSSAEESATKFVSTFNLSSTESIDLFLSRQPQFREIGRTAICLSILRAEENSDFREQVDRREHDWYFCLYNMLTREAIGKEDYLQFARNPIAFVTFNYDRSLEYFLFDSLRHSFEGIDELKTKQQLDATPIIHVYGKPAPLPWETADGKATVEYGERIGKLALKDLRAIIDNLHVIHDERSNPELERARVQISDAERVFFLGFAYARENLEALGLPDALRPSQHIYGTAFERTKREIHDIERFFTLGLEHADARPSNKASQVKIIDCDSVSLLREFPLDEQG